MDCSPPGSSVHGCPSGSYFAQSTDKIAGPTLSDVSVLVLLYRGPLPVPANFYVVNYVPPPMFNVTDSSGTPRNNICIVLTTSGIWWTDNTETTPLIGSGVDNQITVTTDHQGTVTPDRKSTRLNS